MRFTLILNILLGFALLGLDRCDTNNCQDIVCGFNQFCSNGTCFCLDGYEGSSCDEEAYLKYSNRNWFVSESCADGSSHGSFQSFIRYTGEAVNKVWIDNFAGLGISVPAYIYTNFENRGNVIEVDYSQGLIQDIVGRGNYIEFDNSITMETTYTENSQFRQCVLTFR